MTRFKDTFFKIKWYDSPMIGFDLRSRRVHEQDDEDLSKRMKTNEPASEREDQDQDKKKTMTMTKMVELHVLGDSRCQPKFAEIAVNCGLRSISNGEISDVAVTYG